MSQLIEAPAAAPAPASVLPVTESTPNSVRWTRQQYYAIREANILVGRYELVNGEIISKMGQKRPHAYTIVLLMKWLVAVFGGDYVQLQLPIDVLDADNNLSEPEPDAAVFAQPITAYAERNPGPSDLRLVIEVSDTTLQYDRKTKAALYARAGIVEYWIVDVTGRQIFAHRQPTPQGYGDVQAYRAGEQIATLARPDAPVAVTDLLPPA